MFSLWLSLRPSFLQLPSALPNKGAGMSGFHDANEVKTWLCVNWQSRSSSWSAASFSSGSESDPPPTFIQRRGLLCTGMSLALSSSHNPCWSREVGCRGKFGANPQGSEYYPNPRPPPTSPPLFFTEPQLYPQLCPCDFPADNRRPWTKRGICGPYFSFPIKKKSNAAVVIYYPINASRGKTMRRPVLLICLWPQGQ